MHRARRDFLIGSAVALFLTVTTIFAVFAGISWLMSPLGLGFATWPADPYRRGIAMKLFSFSYFIGLPLLLIGQAVAIFAGVRGMRRTALVVSILAISLFTLSAGLSLSMLEP